MGTSLASSSANQGGMEAFLAGDMGVSKLDLMLVMAEDADRGEFAINLQVSWWHEPWLRWLRWNMKPSE